MTEGKDISKLSFEEAMRELEAVISRLENGGLDLDKAIEDYSYGEKLKTTCEAKLKEAKLKLEKVISQNSEGEIKTEVLEA